MTWDDDDIFDFDYDDLSQEEKDEIDREIHAKRVKLKNHPLYKKANEISDIVSALIESLPEDLREMYESTLLESSMILSPKIAGAMGCDSWLICMQNASIIRHHAEYLLTSTSGLKAFGKPDEDYVQVLRDEMFDFQKLFKEWVGSFHKMNWEEYEDEWGLYIRKV
ncbi:hypothetical protein JYT51_01000 [Candidatus Amoebophilus asiaticus]|nr:hypothetical protein [Candidatus Amoebophilus asiaticus]